jgi:hypothetical protein
MGNYHAMAERMSVGLCHLHTSECHVPSRRPDHRCCKGKVMRSFVSSIVVEMVYEVVRKNI